MLHSLLYFACLRNLTKQLACVSTEVDSRHIVLILMQQHSFAHDSEKKNCILSLSQFFSPSSSPWLTGWRCGALGSLQSAAGLLVEAWFVFAIHCSSVSVCQRVSQYGPLVLHIRSDDTLPSRVLQIHIHRYSQYLEKAPSSLLNTVSPPEIGKLVHMSTKTLTIRRFC